MPVNPEILDHEFPPTEPYLVGREKIREFARAVFATDQAHFDLEVAAERGYSDLLAPPTFPIVIQDLTLKQLLALPGSGIDLSHVLHAEQRFEFKRQIVAGDELSAQLKVTNIRTLGSNAMVTSEARITDAQGDDVVTAISVLLVSDSEGAA